LKAKALNDRALTLQGRSRRHFLSAAVATLAGLALPLKAMAFGDASKFAMPLLEYPGSWNLRAGAPPRLMWELMKRTSIEAIMEPQSIAISDPALFSHPFIYLSGEADFAPFSDDDSRRLRRWLDSGGFLMIDNFGEADGAFDRAVRRELGRTLPETKLEPVVPEHTLFQSFYLLDGRWGRRQEKSIVEGLVRDGRLAVVYSQNDIGGAWLRDNFGNWELPCVPGGERQREMAFRLGINIVMYALCTTYKSDQVHIPFILKRRRK